MKKLMIIGSNTIHVYNYIDLVKEYFDDILLITNEKREGTDVKTIELDFHLKLSSRIKTVGRIKKLIKEYSPSVICQSDEDSEFCNLFNDSYDDYTNNDCHDCHYIIVLVIIITIGDRYISHMITRIRISLFS